MAVRDWTARRLGGALLFTAWLAGTQTFAAALSPSELTQLAGRTTYEVVLPKNEPESGTLEIQCRVASPGPNCPTKSSCSGA